MVASTAFAAYSEAGLASATPGTSSATSDGGGDEEDTTHPASLGADRDQVLGILVWALAVAAGLGVLLQANPRVWVALQLVGGAALVGLGVQSVLRSGTARSRDTDRRPGAGSFVPALLTALINPRAGIVAVSLLPQFVGPGQDPAATTVALGLAWASVAGAWNLVGVQLVDRSRGWFAGRRGRRTTDLLSGGFLVAIGLSSGWAAL